MNKKLYLDNQSKVRIWGASRWGSQEHYLIDFANRKDFSNFYYNGFINLTKQDMRRLISLRYLETIFEKCDVSNVWKNDINNFYNLTSVIEEWQSKRFRHAELGILWKLKLKVKKVSIPFVTHSSMFLSKPRLTLDLGEEIRNIGKKT